MSTTTPNPSETAAPEAPDAPRPPAGGWLQYVVALILGLGGIAFIAFFSHWYEVGIFKSPYPQTVVHVFPPIVFFMLLVVVGVLNPVFRLIHRGLVVKRAGLVMILSFWLFASVISYEKLTSPILMRIGIPFSSEVQDPGYDEVKAYLPRKDRLYLPAEIEGEDSDSLEDRETPARDWYFGIGEQGSARNLIDPGRIPWKDWWGPLAFWVPLMLVFIVFSMSMIRVVHRQWSRHELLTYPVAMFSNSILDRSKGRFFPDIFHNRTFQVGFILISILYLLNGLQLHFPQMVQIPLKFSYYDLVNEFPFLNNYCGKEAYSLFRGMVYPFLVALAVLLPTEISFTAWAGWVLMILATGFYFLITGHVIGGTEVDAVQIGGVVAVTAMIIIIGRREYASILYHAFSFKRAEDDLFRNAVWACRVFILSFISLWLLLTWSGIDWPIALMTTVALAMVLLVMARMVAEAGLIWLPDFRAMASMMPLKLLGAAAVGPHSLAALSIVASGLDMFTYTSVAQQQTTASRITELLPERHRRFVRWSLVLGVLAAVVCGIFFVQWNNYTFGGRKNWRRSPKDYFMSTASAEIRKLELENQLQPIIEETPVERILTRARTQKYFWEFFAYGAAAVGICAFLRLRFTWWPFHPLPLVLFGTWGLGRLYTSFLIGWVIKAAILRIGGGKVFIGSKPFFIGIIVGQVFMTGIWIAINTIIYLRTGIEPPPIRFFGG